MTILFLSLSLSSAPYYSINTRVVQQENFILQPFLDQVSNLCLFFLSFSSLPLVAIGVSLILLFLSSWCNHWNNQHAIQRRLLLLHRSMGKHSEQTASIVFILPSFEDDGINWISWLHGSQLAYGVGHGEEEVSIMRCR